MAVLEQIIPFWELALIEQLVGIYLDEHTSGSKES